jgi:hypothetical protein
VEPQKEETDGKKGLVGRRKETEKKKRSRKEMKEKKK